jgi:hypothetical protein
MNSFKDRYPDFAAIEHHIRRANAERSLYIAHLIVGMIDTVGGGIRRLMSLGANRAADARAIRSDPFLKRSVPKY